MRFNLSIGPWSINLMLSCRRVIEAEGTYSLCSDGSHVVYLDYDVTEEEALKLELNNLMGLYGLSEFHVFSSSENNYHAICLDKVTPEEYENIICSSNCDPNFKRYNRFNGMASRVLRFSKKKGSSIKYLYSLRSKNNVRVKSSAHMALLSTMHDIPLSQGGDDNYKLFTCKYTTFV